MNKTSRVIATGFLILAGAISSWAQGCAPVPPGIVSWWPGDGDARDIASGNDGTIVGGVTFVAGMVGQAFGIDGVDGSGVLIGNPANLQLQVFTIDAWIKRGSVSMATQSSNPGGAEIFGYGQAGYDIGMFNSGQLFLTKTGLTAVFGPFVTDTNWHHIAVTYDGTSAVFYVDGVATGPLAYSATFSFNTSAAIGERADTDSNSFLGAIDELEVFSRVLSAGEIQRIFAAGSVGKCAPFADAFQFAYAANLSHGDSFVNITNSGSAGGNICVNVFAFDPTEELVSCCSCLVTPNALLSLSAEGDLISNTLSPATPTALVIAMVASSAQGDSCDPAKASFDSVKPGLRAWANTLHALPGNPAPFGLTEVDSQESLLSRTELGHLTSFCGFAEANGSGFGICKSCRTGGLAGAKQ